MLAIRKRQGRNKPFISYAAPNHDTKNCVIEVSDEAAYDEAKVKETIEDKDFKYLGEE